ncbi:transcriptional regulator, HxlR family [Lutimaribacter pacificus]|uniref:Transcriptional regulator, HxlR family n=1 Tax=Lutimaribacter pacificus TaxID=391948 RepID=A0A1H0D3K5_9RHOB|nr:winged helix-turn-helix transcriptional regulator [Lutimaribacter pacificus]SDN64695.1 transcriptional regulator, HxlR family [Lutimaribacter pacificus]SHJ37348.1 transcriptional regulator, HxlR family [Lutimaribacter pacificus]
MTKQAETPRIRYDEGCLAAHALNVIGDRWALLVVRELIFAPKRFQMIRAGLPGITASVLTGRLAQLAQAGVLTHDERLGIYTLTDAGHGLLPVLESLCRWALAIPGHDPSRFISPSALMISMGVNLIPDRAQGHDMLAGFDFGGEAFGMRLADARLQTSAVGKPDAPFVLKGSGNTLAAAVYGTTPLPVLVSRGMVDARGDVDAAQEFLSFFRLSAPM